MNVGIVAMVAILFTGCTLLPARNAESDLMDRQGVTADDPTYTELSDDDSLETIEAELDATLIEDEDFSQIEEGFQSEADIQMQGGAQ